MPDSVVEPVDDNEYKGDYEIEKYQDLAREMRKVWNKKVIGCGVYNHKCT